MRNHGFYFVLFFHRALVIQKMIGIHLLALTLVSMEAGLPRGNLDGCRDGDTCLSTVTGEKVFKTAGGRRNSQPWSISYKLFKYLPREK